MSDTEVAEKLLRPVIEMYTRSVVPAGRYGVWHCTRRPLMNEAGTTFSRRLSGSVLLSCHHTREKARAHAGQVREQRYMVL